MVLVENLSACIGPNFIAYRGINLSTGVSPIYVFYTYNFPLNWVYLIINMTILIGSLLLYLDYDFRQKVFSVLLTYTRQRKVLQATWARYVGIQSDKETSIRAGLQGIRKVDSQKTPMEFDSQSN
jgi:hypothetical protein